MALEPGTPMQDVRLDRVFIGSCTNARIGDLRAAARVVEGRKVDADVRAMVVPGSEQVRAQAEAEGLDRVFTAAGFDWRTAGCSMCLGMNPDILSPGRALRVDLEPQLRGAPGPRRAHPPGLARDGRRGRHRGPLRRHQDLEAEHGTRYSVISGGVSALDRADVDTDQIIPKQFLKRVERTGFGEFLFYDWAQEPGWDLPANPILAAGPNFGCGSSREHAPWALQDYGFRAVVSASFADIFFSNCTKIGLLPVVLPEDDVRGADGAPARREVDLEALEVRFDGRAVPFELDAERRRRLLEGLDDIALTLQQADAIAALRGRPRARRAGDHGAVARCSPERGNASTVGPWRGRFATPQEEARCAACSRTPRDRLSDVLTGLAVASTRRSPPRSRRSRPTPTSASRWSAARRPTSPTCSRCSATRRCRSTPACRPRRSRFATALVRRGIDPGDLVHAYLVGQNELWRAWMEALTHGSPARPRDVALELSSVAPVQRASTSSSRS